MKITICLLAFVLILCSQLFPNFEKKIFKKIEKIIKRNIGKVEKDELIDALNEYNPLTLNTIEKELNEKLKSYQKTFRSEHSSGTYQTSQLFNNIIWNTDLYKFAYKLPKGAETHVHTGAMMSPYEYLEYLKQYDTTYINTNFNNSKPLKKDENELLKYYESSDKVKPGFVQLKTYINETENYNKVINLFRCDPEQLPEGIKPWDYFNSLSGKRIKEESDEMKKHYYQESFEGYAKNNIFHIETKYNVQGNIDKDRKIIGLILEGYYAAKKNYNKLTVQIIAACSKTTNTIDECKEKFDIMSILANEIYDESIEGEKHDFIVGIDLVSEEDKSKELHEYGDIIKETLEKQPKFKLVVHAGETMSIDNDNVIDALVQKSFRVGHAINLYAYPKIADEYKKNDITIELCPVSNYVLGYVDDLRKHPGLLYLRSGHSVTINSDDPLYFEHNKNSDDFFMALVSWGIDLKDIKFLAYNSISKSLLDDSLKRKAIDNWEADWKTFVYEQLGRTEDPNNPVSFEHFGLSIQKQNNEKNDTGFLYSIGLIITVSYAISNCFSHFLYKSIFQMI